jgi:hypothetical protein
MAVNDYLKASRYELLVRKAFNCPRELRNGAHSCFMENAMTMERGETFAKHLGSCEKQFDEVKQYISKALIKFSKTKPYSTHSNFFIELNERLSYLNTTSELMEIVDTGLDKANELTKNKI